MEKEKNTNSRYRHIFRGKNEEVDRTSNNHQNPNNQPRNNYRPRDNNNNRGPKRSFEDYLPYKSLQELKDMREALEKEISARLNGTAPERKPYPQPHPHSPAQHPNPHLNHPRHPHPNHPSNPNRPPSKEDTKKDIDARINRPLSNKFKTSRLEPPELQEYADSLREEDSAPHGTLFLKKVPAHFTNDSFKEYCELTFDITIDSAVIIKTQDDQPTGTAYLVLTKDDEDVGDKVEKIIKKGFKDSKYARILIRQSRRRLLTIEELDEELDEYMVERHELGDKDEEVDKKKKVKVEKKGKSKPKTKKEKKKKEDSEPEED
jgi:hypothetical protein